MNINERTIAFLQFQLPALAWCMFIYIASSIPSDNIPAFTSWSDKFVHAGVFAMLCWLTHVAFFHQPMQWLKRHSLLLAVLFTALYGITDEFHQSFTPGRYSDPLDLLADAVGGLLYASLHTWLKFYRYE
jgi:VanZ family protein